MHEDDINFRKHFRVSSRHGSRQRHEKKLTDEVAEHPKAAPRVCVPLEPFNPTSEMIHLTEDSGNPHCLLHAFHMATRQSLPTPAQMEIAMQKFQCDNIEQSRWRGYNIQTLRCALALLKGTGTSTDRNFVLAALPKPHCGWTWPQLSLLLEKPDVLLLSCVINNPIPKQKVIPIRHFVAFDVRTSQYGDSLAPSIQNLDLSLLEKASRSFEPCSIRSVLAVYRLLVE
jgi:hypothetical protein